MYHNIYKILAMRSGYLPLFLQVISLSFGLPISNTYSCMNYEELMYGMAIKDLNFSINNLNLMISNLALPSLPNIIYT